MDNDWKSCIHAEFVDIFVRNKIADQLKYNDNFDLTPEL